MKVLSHLRPITSRLDLLTPCSLSCKVHEKPLQCDETPVLILLSEALCCAKKEMLRKEQSRVPLPTGYVYQRKEESPHALSCPERKQTYGYAVDLGQ